MKNVRLVTIFLVTIMAWALSKHANAEPNMYSVLSDTTSSMTFRETSGFSQIGISDRHIRESLIDLEIILDEVELEERNKIFDELIDGSGIEKEIGGDVVGNGGGSIEPFAYYYYYNLQSHIQSALDQVIIYFSEKERVILQSILLALPTMEQEGKIVFVPEEGYEDFFYNEEEDRAPRVAKTGFSTDSRVFINLDKAYEMAEVNPRFWITLLVHELGHQIGVADHTMLEELGTKVQQIANNNMDSISINLPNGDKLELAIQNHNYYRSISDLYFSMDNKIMAVKKWSATNLLMYLCGRRIYKGATIENLHWENRGDTSTQGLFIIKARGWMDVSCEDYQTKENHPYTRDIEVTIKVGIGTGMMSGEVEVL